MRSLICRALDVSLRGRLAIGGGARGTTAPLMRAISTNGAGPGAAEQPEQMRQIAERVKANVQHGVEALREGFGGDHAEKVCL